MIHYFKDQYSREGVQLDPRAAAFRYGVGFFETLFYNGQKICHLDLHLDRLLHSLRVFDIEYETVDFEEIINQVIHRNGLVGETSRINIFYPIEEEKAYPMILATRHESKPYKAYRLCVCSDRHVSTLNGQKTTSYMFFHLAMKQAQARGFDDAALVDFRNNLLESTTGALVLEKNGDFFQMDSPYRLPSTALAVAESVIEILPKTISIDDLPSYNNAYILNSIIGMRPVVAIGETAFVPNEDVCRKVTEAVIEDSL
jgi:4-amino-4-deoxychorismate lyase